MAKKALILIQFAVILYLVCFTTTTDGQQNLEAKLANARLLTGRRSVASIYDGDDGIITFGG
jgi:hypothetical protein